MSVYNVFDVEPVYMNIHVHVLHCASIKAFVLLYKHVALFNYARV